MKANSTQRPLQGIRVIDFGQYVAGPAAAMMLGDSGAEVIRIDPQNGPLWDSPANAILHRGKKRITLDLKSEEGRRIAGKLIEGADVLIENFRPAVMQKLGLGYEALSKLNPKLIYLSLPGFAAVDEQYRDTAAWEAVVSSAVGQFTDMGLNRTLMGVTPSYSPLVLASAYAAVFGALAITCALYKRAKTGAGDYIEVPLAAALMEGLVYNSMHVERYPDRYKSLRELEIERRQAFNLPMDMSYDDVQGLLDPFHRTYVCKDGRPFYLVCGSHRSHAIRALQLLGLWEEMQAAGIPNFNPYLNQAQWPDAADCTIRAYPMSKKWVGILVPRMKERFLQHTALEWETLFGEAAVPGCAHRTTKEWINSPHALASGLIVKVDDPVHGSMLQAGPVAWLGTDVDAAAHPRPAHRADEDREELMVSLELDSPSSAAELKADTMPWLAGVRILDLTNVIAGPTIATTLARFGAEVIKIDPTEPTFDPWNTIVIGLQAQRGKVSMLCDLKTDAGQEILTRLIKTVDVVTINATEKQLGPLGLDFERLKSLKPDIILCQLDAFGGPHQGERSNYPGYDDLVQATTGIMTRFGGCIDTPEEHAHLGTIDVLGGLCAAVAIGMALVKRERTGTGDVARSSLAAAGQLIQIPFMYDFAERLPFAETSGRLAKGEHALYSAYKASDGWFFLAGSFGDLPALSAALDLPRLSTASRDQLSDILASHFSGSCVEEWAHRLEKAGFAIQPMNRMTDVRQNSLQTEEDVDNLHGEPTFRFVRHKHAAGREVDIVDANAIRPRFAAIVRPTAAPKYGSGTRSVMQTIGYSEADIDKLMHEKTIADRWSELYLPS